jgi:hypothetical protein
MSALDSMLANVKSPIDCTDRNCWGQIDLGGDMRRRKKYLIYYTRDFLN